MAQEPTQEGDHRARVLRMPIDDQSAQHDFRDKALRQSSQHPEHLRAFLGKAVPQLAGGFDCGRARLLEREFPIDDWRRREGWPRAVNWAALRGALRGGPRAGWKNCAVCSFAWAVNAFGEPGEGLSTALAALTDLERMERMADRILLATGWQDLLDTA
jgi:hypothetical protein